MPTRLFSGCGSVTVKGTGPRWKLGDMRGRFGTGGDRALCGGL